MIDGAGWIRGRQRGVADGMDGARCCYNSTINPVLSVLSYEPLITEIDLDTVSDLGHACPDGPHLHIVVGRIGSFVAASRLHCDNFIAASAHHYRKIGGLNKRFFGMLRSGVHSDLGLRMGANATQGRVQGQTGYDLPRVSER